MCALIRNSYSVSACSRQPSLLTLLRMLAHLYRVSIKYMHTGRGGGDGGTQISSQAPKPPMRAFYLLINLFVYLLVIYLCLLWFLWLKRQI